VFAASNHIEQMYDLMAPRRGAVDELVDNSADLVDKPRSHCGRPGRVCGSGAVERGHGVDTQTRHFHKM
jgi:hypothetical protein